MQDYPKTLPPSARVGFTVSKSYSSISGPCKIDATMFHMFVVIMPTVASLAWPITP